MVPRDERDRIDFLGLEAAQVAVLDQIVRMLVMALVADMHADVVQQRRVLEPFALAVGHPVHAACLLENRHREPRHLRRVLRPVVAAFRQLDDAAAPDVGIAIGLRDLLAMARDVVEHESLAEGHVAQGDFLRAEPADDRVEQHGTGDRQVGPPRLEAGYAQPLFETELHELLPDAAQLLGRDAPVAQDGARRTAALMAAWRVRRG